MNAPDKASYQQLLEVIEERLWLEENQHEAEDFGYLVDLVNDLYIRTIETSIATLNGCIQPAHVTRPIS